MPTPRSSLNSGVQWTTILQALNLPVRSRALPSYTNCPFCKNHRLRILQDYQGGGQWQWCEDCRRGGDMLELAAKVWKLSVTATISKLRRLGLQHLTVDKDAINRYTAEHLEKRRDIREMWEKAQGELFQESTTIGRLANVFDIAMPSPTRWAEGPGQLVGALHYKDIENTLFATGGPRKRNHLFKRIHNRPWDDVMVIPLYELPGHPCAFLFAGRQGDREKDVIFKVLPRNPWGLNNEEQSERKEAGLAIHPGIFEAASRWGHHVVATADPFLMLHLQSRHAELSPSPLPLAGWYCDMQSRPRNAWRMFTNQRLVHWAPSFDPAVFYHAVVTDGLISTLGPTSREPAEIRLELRRKFGTPENLVTQLIETARPWPEVLAAQFNRMDNRHIENFMLELELDGMNLDRIRRKAPSKLQARLDEVMTNDTIARVCTIDEKTIIESHGRWIIGGRQEELVMNAQLRIDAVIRRPEAGKTYYQGKLLFEGRAYEFCVPKATLKVKPFEFLEDLVEADGALIYNPTWARRLVPIAFHFQKPVSVKGLEKVGWNDATAGFVLPKYRICVGGEVKRNEFRFFPDDAPGNSLEFPEKLAGQDLDALLNPNVTTTVVTMATLTGLIANIVAPSLNRRTSGIAVIGNGASDVALLTAARAGCATKQLEGQRERNYLAVQKVELSHGWPLCVVPDLAHGRKFLAEWQDATGPTEQVHNCIAAFSAIQGVARKLFTGWHVIDDREPAGIMPPEMLTAIQRFIPAYLQDLCERRLQLPINDGPWGAAVLADIKDFVKRHHGKFSQWDSVEAVMTFDHEGDHNAFAELLSMLLRAGKIDLVPEGYDGKKPALIRHDEDNSLAVPKQRLADLLSREAVAFSDFGWITAVLARGGVLKEDQAEFWLVDLNWWALQHRRGDTAQGLRIVS